VIASCLPHVSLSPFSTLFVDHIYTCTSYLVAIGLRSSNPHLFRLSLRSLALDLVLVCYIRNTASDSDAVLRSMKRVQNCNRVQTVGPDEDMSRGFCERSSVVDSRHDCKKLQKEDVDLCASQ
jgi:hypothetical protein